MLTNFLSPSYFEVIAPYVNNSVNCTFTYEDIEIAKVLLQFSQPFFFYNKTCALYAVYTLIAHITIHHIKK